MMFRSGSYLWGSWCFICLSGPRIDWCRLRRLEPWSHSRPSWSDRLNLSKFTVCLDVSLSVAHCLTTFGSLVENRLGKKPGDFISRDVDASEVGFGLLWVNIDLTSDGIGFNYSLIVGDRPWGSWHDSISDRVGSIDVEIASVVISVHKQ